MSRSGYNDDCSGWDLIRWRGAVNSATVGARGQKLLKDMLEALDAMPVKKLVSGELEEDGNYCALGVLGKLKGIQLSKLDPEDYDAVAKAFDIAPALAREIVYENDEAWYQDTPETRWIRMRNWVEKQITATA
jgi:hypothetical protein